MLQKSLNKFLLLVIAVQLALAAISCKSAQVDTNEQAGDATEPDNSFFLERDKWEQADKESLKDLNDLRNSFTDEQMRETASDYIYTELDKEIRKHAIWKKLPQKYHELQVCVISECKSTMLYEVFRKFKLSFAKMVIAGLTDLKAKVAGRTIILQLQTSNGLIQFYFRIIGEQVKLFKVAVNNDIWTNPEKIKESAEGIVIGLSEWPAEEEISYAAIDFIRLSKGNK